MRLVRCSSLERHVRRASGNTSGFHSLEQTPLPCRTVPRRREAHERHDVWQAIAVVKVRVTKHVSISSCIASQDSGSYCYTSGCKRWIIDYLLYIAGGWTRAVTGRHCRRILGARFHCPRRLTAANRESHSDSYHRGLAGSRIALAGVHTRRRPSQQIGCVK